MCLLYAMLRANPHKLAVPMLIPANVCFLINKLNYIRRRGIPSQRDGRNSCVDFLVVQLEELMLTSVQSTEVTSLAR